MCFGRHKRCEMHARFFTFQGDPMTVLNGMEPESRSRSRIGLPIHFALEVGLPIPGLVRLTTIDLPINNASKSHTMSHNKQFFSLEMELCQPRFRRSVTRMRRPSNDGSGAKSSGHAEYAVSSAEHRAGAPRPVPSPSHLRQTKPAEFTHQSSTR